MDGMSLDGKGSAGEKVFLDEQTIDLVSSVVVGKNEESCGGGVAGRISAVSTGGIPERMSSIFLMKKSANWSDSSGDSEEREDVESFWSVLKRILPSPLFSSSKFFEKFALSF